VFGTKPLPAPGRRKTARGPRGRPRDGLR